MRENQTDMEQRMAFTRDRAWALLIDELAKNDGDAAEYLAAILFTDDFEFDVIH